MAPGSAVQVRVDVSLIEPASALCRLSSPFSSLIAMLQKQDSDLSRLSVLVAAGESRSFTVSELLQICRTFEMELHRVSAIKQALPHLSDPDNAYQILNALESLTFKDEVSRLISNQPRPPK